MKKLSYLILLLAAFAFNSCQKDFESAPALVSEDDATTVIANENGDGAITDRAGCSQSIVIPANSVNALADALNNVCTGGTIWLASGLHTENAGVIIGKRVTIKGQNGAVLKLQSTPLPTGLGDLDPGLLFKHATNSVLENITFEPTSKPGGNGILLDKSGGTVIKGCKFNDFQYSVIVHRSVATKFFDNKIVVANNWETGELADAHGIIVCSGAGARLTGNDVSGGLFGIWVCDREGIYKNNYTHHNYVGFILCNVPEGVFTPDGEDIAAIFPAAHWTVSNNVSKHNADAGYLIIDGANKNKLISNEGGDNGTYDFDFVGESYRFGFLTPTSHDNVMWANNFQNVTVKDCGVNNIIYGGIMIDNETSPCY